MLKEYGYIQFLTYEKNCLFIYLQIRSIIHLLTDLFLRKFQFTHVCEQNYSFYKIENKKFDLQLYFSMKRGNTGKRI